MLRKIFLAISTSLFLVTTAIARDGEKIGSVDTAIVLAVDASGSVSSAHWWMQLRGYAAAFRSEGVLGAIRQGGRRAIAITLVQWSGRGEQVQSIVWHRVHDTSSAEMLAEKIDRVGRYFNDKTCITDALFFSTRILKEKKFDSYRDIIDISGDGKNRHCPSVHFARDAAVRGGIVINGLPIVAEEKDVVDHYRYHVIGGAGSFVEVAENYEDFPRAIRKKLIQEIAQR